MKRIWLLMILCSFLGCKSADPWGESAVFRAPDKDPTIGLPTGVAPSEESCTSPLIDADDGSQLILMRSSNGLGDYQVQEGRYGLQAGEFLRIDCRTREIIGIVRQ